MSRVVMDMEVVYFARQVVILQLSTAPSVITQREVAEVERTQRLMCLVVEGMVVGQG
jgi:hypothetical protein